MGHDTGVRSCALWLTCGTLVARIALAQAAPGDADRLFEEGRALAKAGDYPGACARFAASLEIDHSLGTELNLADCKEKLGELREAWRLFTAVATESARSADTKRTQFARERAAAVATKLTTVVIKVTKPQLGMAITVGGHAVDPATEIVDLVEPGTIAVVATAPNRPPFETTVTGEASATVHVTVPPFGDPAIASPPPPPSSATRDGGRDRDRVHLAWGLGAGAVASALAGTAFAWIGKRHYDAAADGSDCMHTTAGLRCGASGTDAIHAAQRLADVGTGFAIATLALGVASAIVYVTAPHTTITIAPVVGAHEGGAALAIHF